MKNSKIFGKINILDLIIILGIIAAAIFFLTRGGVTGVFEGPTATQTHVVRFFAHRIDSFIVEPISIDDAVVVQGTEIGLGNVTYVDRMPGIEFHPNSYGVLTGSPLFGTYNVEIESQIDLPVGSINNGLHIGGNRFAVGQSFPIRFGNSLIFLRISYIGVLD